MPETKEGAEFAVRGHISLSMKTYEVLVNGKASRHQEPAFRMSSPGGCEPWQTFQELNFGLENRVELDFHPVGGLTKAMQSDRQTRCRFA